MIRLGKQRQTYAVASDTHCCTFDLPVTVEFRHTREMSSFDLLQQLLLEVSLEEKALEEKKRVVAFLQKRVDDELKAATSGVPGVTVSHWNGAVAAADATSITSSRIGLPLRRGTAVDAIADFIVIMPMPDEFTVADVIGALIAAKLPVSSKTLVAPAINRLIECGAIVRTDAGGGSSPGRYRKIQSRAQEFQLDFDRWKSKEVSGKSVA